MRIVKSMLLAIALSVISNVAVSQPVDPKITSTVSAYLHAVSVSRVATDGTPLTTLGAYLLSFTNNSTNTLNNPFFTASATNDLLVATKIDSVIVPPNWSCTPTPSLTVRCSSTVSLAPGDSSGQAVVFVQAPSAGNFIYFSYSVGGYEGGSGTNSCCANPGSDRSVALTDPTLNSSFNFHVKSVLKQPGGYYFTGNNAISTLAAPIGTAVAVPTWSTDPNVYTSSDISSCSVSDPNSLCYTAADATSCASQKHFSSCYRSTLSIPGVNFFVSPTQPPTGLLDILLRIDSSQIKSGTKIESVQISYTDEANPAMSVPNVQLCGTTTPEQYPCIHSRVYYKNKTVPGWTLDLDGDFEWRIYHFKNGGYTIR